MQGLKTVTRGCYPASGWLGLGRETETFRYGERLSGEGGNPNLLAFNLILSLTMAVGFYLTTRRAWVKLLLVGTVVMMLFGIVASLSPASTAVA